MKTQVQSDHRLTKDEAGSSSRYFCFTGTYDVPLDARPRVRHFAQFKSRFEAFLASSLLYGEAKSFNFEYATTLIRQAEKGVDDLVRLARLDGKLQREQKVVRAMQIGIEQSLVNTDPITGL